MGNLHSISLIPEKVSPRDSPNTSSRRSQTIPHSVIPAQSVISHRHPGEGRDPVKPKTNKAPHAMAPCRNTVVSDEPRAGSPNASLRSHVRG
ncbi:protein of unknown function [Hyphomicrobium sp. MC1]|nr:protein of unknown function [Hyphomicrobium sp. MC1]